MVWKDYQIVTVYSIPAHKHLTIPDVRDNFELQLTDVTYVSADNGQCIGEYIVSVVLGQSLNCGGFNATAQHKQHKLYH